MLIKAHRLFLYTLPIILSTKISPAADSQFYGSLRLQAKYIQPDNNSANFDNYIGLRDAYSRVGLKVSHRFSNTWHGVAQVELPTDSARQTAFGGENSDPADSGGRSLHFGIRYDF